MIAAEQWRAVPGFDGYEVSDAGRVRSWRLGGWGNRHRSEPVLLVLQRSGRDGTYRHVTLWGNGRANTRGVHRLVMTAFVGPRPEGQEIRHLNGNSSDNRLANLAYGTRSENMRDQVRHGTHSEASKTHCPQGHEYTPENTKVYRGRRTCRTCARRSSLAWYYRNKAVAA